MKKVVLIILIIGIMVFGSFAQMNDMLFGVKGGLTLGRISGFDDEISDDNAEYRIGVALGGMMIIPLNEKFYLQSELMYVMKGQKYDFSVEEVTMVFDVLEIPILVKYMAVESIAVYGGPTFDYLMTAKMDSDEGEVDLKDEDLVKSMAFGLSFGAQYKMDKILFDLRYDLGLSDVLDEDSSSASEIKMNTIYVTVGYLF